ncbi:MAG: kelch repeat-containing protein, partial [Planctomycetota bacterium]|nr:kelch repeat-containing protein [Planctomycetota bacterium]
NPNTTYWYRVRSYNNDGDSAPSNIASATIILKPDAMIKATDSTDYIGDNIYNLDAISQTAYHTASNNQTVTYYIRICNDGNVSEGYTLSGSPGNAQWAVSYYDGYIGADITSGIVNGQVGTAVDAGGYYPMRLEVRPISASDGSFLDTLIIATSHNDPSKKDTVKARTELGSLVGWWKFDETSGTTAADSSGKGNNGTLCNGPVWSGGNLNFDGVDDYVAIPNTVMNPPKITVSSWLMPNVYTDTIRYIDKGNPDSNGWSVGIYSYKAYFTAYINGIRYDVYGTTVLQTDQWYFISTTYDGSTMKVYLNGNLEGSSGITGTMPSNSYNLQIGGAPYYRYKGLIDDVKLYDYVRTAAEIQAEYNASPAAYWTQKIAQGTGGSPSARNSHSMVWDGTRVIMFGGWDDGGPRNDLWWYYPLTNTWTQKIVQGAAGSPPARRYHSMVWDGQRVIMFGGAYGANTAATSMNDLWWYDPNTNTWTEKTPAVSPSARCAHSMVWDGTRVIMFGGVGVGGGRWNDLWWYYPLTNTWTQKIAQGAPGSPSGREVPSMVWDGIRVIMFGGYDGAYKNDLWWYDPGTNTWTQKIADGAAGSPLARYITSMVWDGIRVIMFGGADLLNNYYNDIWWYDPGTNTWTQKIARGTAGSPTVRGWHSMVWDGIRVIMFGGWDGAYKNDLWWYNP